MSRTSKLMAYVNWRMRITLSDTRQLVGTFLAFDRHMNLVLGDTEEFRKIKAKKGAEEKEERRVLGLVLLRGECVISLTADAPPPPKPKAQVLVGNKAPGVGTPAGRGTTIAPIGAAPLGLSGPVRGVGGASGAVMQPQMQGAPVAYAGRGGPPPSAYPPPPGTFAGRGGPPQGAYPPPPFAMGRGGPPPSGYGPPPGAYPPPPGAYGAGRGGMPPQGAYPPPPGAYPPPPGAYPPPPGAYGAPGAGRGYAPPPQGAYPPPPGAGRGYPGQ